LKSLYLNDKYEFKLNNTFNFSVFISVFQKGTNFSIKTRLVSEIVDKFPAEEIWASIVQQKGFHVFCHKPGESLK